MLDRALKTVLKWEGGYVNHPKDPGGATNMGITQKTLQGWRGAPVTAEDMKALTHKEAEAIYKARYWAACQCEALEFPVALMVFDAAVNHGPGRQTAAGGAGRDGGRGDRPGDAGRGAGKRPRGSGHRNRRTPHGVLRLAEDL